jgi:hypothetical protein
MTMQKIENYWRLMEALRPHAERRKREELEIDAILRAFAWETPGETLDDILSAAVSAFGLAKHGTTFEQLEEFWSRRATPKQKAPVPSERTQGGSSSLGEMLDKG